MIILDGGLGRELQAMGAPFRQPEWSALALIEKPEFVRKAHAAFLQAGADIITTNSYALVPFHIGEKMFLERGTELLQLSGSLARAAVEASDRPVKVAASIPPMFGSYQPANFKPTKAADMMGLFYEQLSDFSDIFLAETLGSVIEAEIFLEVFSQSELPIWLSVTLEDANVESGCPKLRSGESIVKIFKLCERMLPTALLFNCSQPEVMEDAIQVSISHFSGKNCPLIGVYANAFPLAGEEYEGANASIYELRKEITPNAYADYAERWAKAGAGIIGGCCGISPLHIQRLKERLTK